MRRITVIEHVAVSSLFLLFVFSSIAAAKPIHKNAAENAGRGWLRENARPMEKAIGRQFSETVAYTSEQDQTLYYVINLQPEGFMVLSGDDAIEPVIAFSSSGQFVDDNANPLKVMLDKDMAGRLAALEASGGDSKDKEVKWNRLRKTGGETEPQALGEIGLTGIGAVSLVYVDPFVQSQWDQGDAASGHCYNYYTPNNYPTGCVATAMAQVMRYYQWPTSGIGSHSFNISVDHVSQTAWTRGGDGLGGAYNWAQMPLNPQAGLTTTQREAIGSLCYDAGVSVEMAYASSSSASLYDSDQQLTATFLYGSSVYTQSFSSSGDSRLWNILNANLDAQMPVMLGVRGPVGGHAIIADGYGYNGGTLYHHINMGWGGQDNAWYQLPTIDASYTYTVIDDCIYNVYTSGTGEIISGRVTSLAGAPLSGVTVRAYSGTTLVKQTTTNSRGIYALTKLSGSTTYRISAIKTGETFMDQYVTTGSSADWGMPGNRAGVLFVSGSAAPPTAFDVDVQVNAWDSAAVPLHVLDDGEPDPNLLQYIITSLPEHGTLSEPNVGPISSVPYAIFAADANEITYTPCPYFGGEDVFTYKANDGGTYPTGGDSNIATVTVTVNNQLTASFGVDSYTYLYGMMMNTYSYYDTRSQFIYLPGEVGSAKRITSLSLRIGKVPALTLNSWTIRMKHTTKPYFQNAAYELETSGWTVVYQANKNMSPTGWIDFQFSAPFDYNGTQNLMIDFSFNNSSLGSVTPDGGYFIETVVDNRAYTVGSTTGAQGDPLTWGDYWNKPYSLGNRLPSIKLTGTPLIDPVPGDVDATCDVRLPDIAIFAHAWQTSAGQPNYNADCDLTTNKGAVNLQDLIILTDNWLQTYP
ncbi:MAG: C10 family peptidase [Planctomycetaceae bacterium]|nr:C10 family peptidase [Planctomycetaceae bacterium]